MAARLAVDTQTHALPTRSVTAHHENGQYTPQRKTPNDNSSSSPSLTPPETPIADSPSDFASASDDGGANSKSHPSANQPIEFLYDLDLEREDDTNRYVEFGRGVWSAVYKATTTWSLQRNNKTSSRLLFTPPSSPVPAPSSRNRILAVKTPLRRDAHAVLRAEAGVLSVLMRTPRSNNIDDDDDTDFVVPFYGYLPTSSGLVMQAIPLSLASYIDECADVARRHFSTKTMFEPVLSSAQWQKLATQLIRGLDWLHNAAGVVHGDIKPHNILLRSKRVANNPTGFQYDALYGDFSSAHCMYSSSFSSSSSNGNDESSDSSALSALTPPFAAPELMTVAAMKSPCIPATPASDVFALALTLLAAATGDTLVYSAAASGVTSDMQRLAMSRDGHRALDYVRGGPNASRVVRNGLVERTVKPAIVREPAERVVAGEWLGILTR